MTYAISQTDPATLSTEEITGEMDGFIELAEEVVARMSVLLAELRKRRQPHPFFQHAILRFWKSIAEQRLHPRAAILLANRNTIKAVLPLSRIQQLEIAQGGTVAVARLGDDGAVSTEQMTINRMDEPTLKRVFGPAGIRNLSDQEAILRGAAKVTRIGAIKLDQNTGNWKVGRVELTDEDLVRALRHKGYECKWVGGGVNSAA